VPKGHFSANGLRFVPKDYVYINIGLRFVPKDYVLMYKCRYKYIKRSRLYLVSKVSIMVMYIGYNVRIYIFA